MKIPFIALSVLASPCANDKFSILSLQNLDRPLFTQPQRRFYLRGLRSLSTRRPRNRTRRRTFEETQSLVEDYVAKVKTFKVGAPTPEIVEVARQSPTESKPCSPEPQDEAESLITVADFDIPALREDAENPVGQNRNLPRNIRMNKLLRSPFPKRRIRRRFPRRRTKRRSANAIRTSRPEKASSTSIFAIDARRAVI